MKNIDAPGAQGHAPRLAGNKARRVPRGALLRLGGMPLHRDVARAPSPLLQGRGRPCHILRSPCASRSPPLSAFSKCFTAYCTFLVKTKRAAWNAARCCGSISRIGRLRLDRQIDPYAKKRNIPPPVKSGVNANDTVSSAPRAETVFSSTPSTAVKFSPSADERSFAFTT